MPNHDDSHAQTWFSRLARFLSSEPETREEIGALLHKSHASKIIDDDALDIMEGALRIMDMQARDIMIPQSQMNVLKINDSLQQCLETITETGHSRFPVISESGEDISGIFLAKDIIGRMAQNEEKFALQPLLRIANIIPESKRLSVLLREFREQRYHMAIVIDEYGGVSGLITIEDILEEIVGEIEDETDEEEISYISKIADNQYSLETQVEIEDFNEYFDCGFSDEDYDTLGGLLTHYFGYLPKASESIQLQQFFFTIVEADERRIIRANLKVIDGD